MSVETMIYKELTTNNAVKALVVKRIYPLMAPADVVCPYLVYDRSSRGVEYSHDGPDEVQTALFRFVVGGTSYAQTKAVMDAVHGALGGEIAGDGSTTIYKVFVDQPDDQFNDISGVYSRVSTVEVLYQFG